MSDLTTSQQSAMRWFYNAGASGSIQKGGVILCAGQRGRFLPETWLRLVTLGMIEGEAPLRIKISDAGRSYCAKQFGRPDIMKTGWEDGLTEEDDANDDRPEWELRTGFREEDFA